ncbi:hypothetical protein V2G26_012899 [Clonostachys chloroleuca]
MSANHEPVKVDQSSKTGSIEKEPIGSMERVGSVVDADVEDKNGQFHRSFTPRQVHIISLGSNIGSGVFIATGKALATGGPANMVIAYLMVCSCVWSVLQTLSEMTIAFPVSGNYIDYADRWVDPALAFGAGFAEWLGWTAIVAAEASFFHILIGFWSGGSFPLAATISLFLVACLVIFLLPNTVFAWFEYVTSIIKIFLFLIIILLSLAMVLGAGPNGKMHHGETWTDFPVFLNGFGGFANCALLAVWAVGDQVFIGIMGGEAESPRFSMAHATKLVPFRVNFIYMLSVVFVTLLVPSNDPRLLGGGGVAASPFVIAVQEAGIPAIGSILNAGMMAGVLAIAAESVYLSSRVLRSMANQKLIPERFAGVDSQGRPRWALLITSFFAILLAYIQLSAGGLVVFNWPRMISSLARHMPGSLLWPLAPAALMIVSLVLLVCCFYAGVAPVSGLGFSAENFFQYTFGFLVIVFFTIGYKVIFRTPWRDPATADLVTGRRTLGAEEIQQLDNYYRQPPFRRFLTYVQLW